MNTVIEVREEVTLPVSVETAELIRVEVSANTLKAYRHALQKLEAWMHEGVNSFRIDNGRRINPSSEGNGGRSLNDSVLAEYITHLHETGKSPATIAQLVAAVKWRAKNAGRSDVVGVITERTLAGIRRAGKERGRGQVDGLARRDAGLRSRGGVQDLGGS